MSEEFVIIDDEAYSTGAFNAVQYDLANMTVIWEGKDVAVHPREDSSVAYLGTLSMCIDVATQRTIIQWAPTIDDDDDLKNAAPYSMRVAILDLHRMRVHRPPIGHSKITLMLKSGLAYPPLFFHRGGFRNFFSQLKQYATVQASDDDPNLFLLNDSNESQLTRSLIQLDIANNHTPIPSISGPPTNSGSPTLFSATTDNAALVHPPAADMSGTFRDLQYHVFGRFAKVGKIARDTASWFQPNPTAEEEQKSESESEIAISVPPKENPTETKPEKAPQNQISTPEKSEKPENRAAPSSADKRMSAIANAVAGNTPKSAQKRSSTRLALTQKGALQAIQIFFEKPVEVVSKEERESLSKTVMPEDWIEFFDKEGQISDVEFLKKRIFYGGLHPAVRKHAWKFLLGYFAWDSSANDRRNYRLQKAEEYKLIKAQWVHITPEQERRFRKFRERKSLIEKDVVRTDRSHPYFQEESESLVWLYDILVTYTFYNFDVGYCQGMSDLLSPIVSVMQDEVDSFWCFVGLMDVMESNFHTDQIGMQQQLATLRHILAVCQPGLLKYFEQRECENIYFCFRWILICFKREFPFDSVMRLWEALWTGVMGNRFHLFMAAAIPGQQADRIVGEQMDFDSLLMLVNELSGNLNLEQTMAEAEHLVHVVSNCSQALKV